MSHHLILDLDPVLSRSMEACARRERKNLAEWAQDRLRMATLEAEAKSNGYPAAWLSLFGCIEDPNFDSPPRPATRAAPNFDQV